MHIRSPGVRLPALLLALALAACGGPSASPGPGDTPAATPVQGQTPAITPAGTADQTPAGTPAQTPTGTPDQTPAGTPDATAAGTPDASPDVPEGHFVNPVLPVNFPDPHVIEVDGTYYAYATQGLGFKIQMSSSTDMVTWERPREALPRLPLWSPGDVWAPEVAETSAGFVMYYTLRASGVRRPDGMNSQCISYAIADDPAGPFVDPNEEPFVCQPDLGGSIDAHHFVDEDGTPYLVWKNDGNCCSISTRMWIQELSEDGTELLGEPVDMGVRNDKPWEAHVIEAPTVLLVDGTYFLFYSAHDYNSEHYAVGYATSDTVTGPYAEAEENPILTSDGSAAGPGGQAVITDANGDLWVYYHAWDAGRIGDHRGGARSMWLDELIIEDGRAIIDGPDDGPQPAPQPVGGDT
ncbi:MAG TPA: family 43 glycosylhydrolase [Candidatus Limnocylindrales bacterium]|nr:family 43 glycosylhydrolase [Candidatus Limnocylindrales bacterium]